MNKTISLNRDNTFFTSDWHFGDKNIIKNCNRPYSDMDEMHAALIDIWNAKVSDNSTVVNMGDFAFWGPSKFSELGDVLMQLKGNMLFVPGNHDRLNLWHNTLEEFPELADRVRILPPVADFRVGKQHIVGCHYAMMIWNKQHYGAWHLYGHSHDRHLTGIGLSMNICIDAHPNFDLFTYEEIEEKISELEIFRPF